MDWNSVGAVAAFFLTFPPVLLAQPAAGSTLAIRVYNNAGIPQADLRIATREADAILLTGGITASWMECWYRDAESPSASAKCQQPLGSNELTMRLATTESTPITRLVSMGYSLVSLEGRAPFLATVYPALVDSIARSAHVDRRLLLGRAIAHEIGHLLLNSNRHADAGLMREKWSRLELQKNNRSDWEFQEREAAIMRAEIATRGAAQLAAVTESAR